MPLEVDALAGGPGVRTRRYAGEDATDADNNRKLLAALDATGVPYAVSLTADHGGHDLPERAVRRRRAP